MRKAGCNVIVIVLSYVAPRNNLRTAVKRADSVTSMCDQFVYKWILIYCDLNFMSSCVCIFMIFLCQEETLHNGHAFVRCLHEQK